MLLWNGKGKPDPSAKNNRKYDMGKSQLSGFWTLNTVSQTGEGIPWKQWVDFALRKGPLLIWSFFLSSQLTHKVFPRLQKRKIKILCLLSGQWLRSFLWMLKLYREGISMSVSCSDYKSELNWGEVVTLARLWQADSLKKTLSHWYCWIDGLHQQKFVRLMFLWTLYARECHLNVLK